MKTFLAIFSSLVMGAAAYAQTPPSIDDYAAMTNMTSVSISPNGERIVFISGESRATRNIIVASLVGGAPVVVDAGDDQVITGVSWLSDEHIFVTYSQRTQIQSMAQRFDVGRPYIMRVDDQHIVELEQGVTLANIDDDDPNSALVWIQAAHNRGTDRTGRRHAIGWSLFRQDLNSNDRRRVFNGTGGYSYVLNGENEPVVRYEISNENEFELWSRVNSDGWQQVHEERWELNREFMFAGRRTTDWISVMRRMNGLDRTGRYGYFGSETLGERGTLSDGRRQAVFRFDFHENRIEGPVVSSDFADVTGVLSDWRDNSIIGVSWNEERRKVEYFDPEFAELYTQLEGFFPDSNVNIVSWDRDFQKVVINVTGGHTSGIYYLIDRVSGDVQLLSRSRPRIPDAVVSPVEIIHYTAQDGLELFGYLTLPYGREHENLPAVLLPHGGPEARDYYGFDPWAQFLASRGYAVFQPQFRGSDTFGTEFVERGYENWGEEMQTDLWDGMQALVDAGTVDANRVCIFGWSYGGYAAYAGATMTPDLYRCAISGAGVSDIVTMMAYARDRGNGDSQAYWARNIGDWLDDPAHTRAISPAQQVNNLRTPLLIIHGTDDLIVPFTQAEFMARALDEAGMPYEMVAIQEGPHQSYRMQVHHVQELYENLERFLFEHNPPDPVTN
jgi:dipeptidyl aminopeptidase/acylaminoacyl peptidase